MKPYAQMTDRDLLLALVRRKPGCTAEYLLEQFNSVRMVERRRLKGILDSAKTAGQIKSGRTHGQTCNGRGCAVATYWLSSTPDWQIPGVPEPRARPTLADVLGHHQGKPEEPIPNYGPGPWALLIGQTMAAVARTSA